MFFLLVSSVYAADYYVKNSGNDNLDGRSDANAWKTLAKVNSQNLEPGDSVYLKRGDTWHESLVASGSGEENEPITYSAYGSGIKPILDLSEDIGDLDWSIYSGKIYMADVGFDIMQIFLDDEYMMLAHHPNSGYLKTDGASSAKNYIMDSDLGLSASQVVGADIYLWLRPWSIDESRITAFSDNTITFLNLGSSNWLPDGVDKYYLSNKLWMLDQAGEWYYGNGKIYIWMPDSSNPSGQNIKASRISYGFYAREKHFITVDNIEFRNIGDRGVYFRDSNNFVVSECDFVNVGSQKYIDYWEKSGTGIYVFKSEGKDIGTEKGTIINNNIKNAKHGGILNDRISNVLIKGNNVENVGIIGWDSNMPVQGIGISANLYGTSDNIIEDNVVSDISYSGITFSQINNIIRRNYVERAMQFLADGGGIYSFGPNNHGSIISRNIITNTGTIDADARGIYLDQTSNNVLVEDNTIFVTRWGMNNHDGYDNTFSGNTVYGCKYGFKSQEDSNAPSSGYIQGNVVTGNIFFSKTGDYLVDYSDYNDGGPGTCCRGFSEHDYNIYSNLDPENVIGERGIGCDNDWRQYSLSEWQSVRDQDLNSRYITQKGSSDPDEDSQILINAGSSSKQYSYSEFGQGKTWTDLDGNSISWPVTLEGFTSKILLYGDGCVSSWDCSACTEWSECLSDEQTRTCTCTDINACNSDYDDFQTRSCSEEESLVVWYSMDSDDMADETILDKSGNAINAVIYGNPEQVSGKNADALHFDGIDDYLDSGFTDDLDDWTVSVWTKSPNVPDSDPDSGPVMKQENFLISWDHTSDSFRGAAGLKVGSTWHAASFGPLDSDRWYHLAATYDGETLRAYRDGELITENTAMSGPPAHSGYSMKVARHAKNDYYFNGALDELKVYNYALSENEIEAEYSSVCVSLAELVQIIDNWLSSQIEIQEVLASIGSWLACSE